MKPKNIISKGVDGILSLMNSENNVMNLPSSMNNSFFNGEDPDRTQDSIVEDEEYKKEKEAPFFQRAIKGF
jgi:hypothetical protein